MSTAHGPPNAIARGALAIGPLIARLAFGKHWTLQMGPTEFNCEGCPTTGALLRELEIAGALEKATWCGDTLVGGHPGRGTSWWGDTLVGVHPGGGTPW